MKIELIKDYNFIPQYYLEKVNIVADTLSRKVRLSERVRKVVRKVNTKLATIRCACWQDLCNLLDFDFVKDRHGYGFIRNIMVKISLKEKILEAQLASN